MGKLLRMHLGDNTEIMVLFRNTTSLRIYFEMLNILHATAIGMLLRMPSGAATKTLRLLGMVKA